MHHGSRGVTERAPDRALATREFPEIRGHPKAGDEWWDAPSMTAETAATGEAFPEILGRRFDDLLLGGPRINPKIVPRLQRKELPSSDLVPESDSLHRGFGGTGKPMRAKTSHR
jgi:hypothetical protein